MTRRMLMGFAAAAMLLCAHDDKIHKATVGEVVSPSADGFEMKTKDGVVKVKYSSKTAFGLDKKPADKAGVKAGGRVGVIGTKLPTGELMAQEVILGVPAPKPAAGKEKHKH